MILARTVVIPDPLARANVVQALAGAGRPAGVASCTVSDATIVVSFDADRTAPELIDALIEIESAFVPARAAAITDPATAAALAAHGLHEPTLDAARIIETYLP